MSVDAGELVDWAELSYDEVISSTMALSRIRRKAITPLRRKKATGKNLSHSFSMVSAELNDENTAPERKSIHFCRSDSGFNDDGSKQDYGAEINYEQIMDISMRSN